MQTQDIVPFYAEPNFDSSRTALSELFNILDENHTGNLTPDMLKEGLKQRKLKIGKVDFELLVRKLDVDQSGDIQEAEFLHVIQDIAQKARFFGTTKQNEMMLDELFCYDYSPEQHLYRVTAQGAERGSLNGNDNEIYFYY